jgi:hypothetical protein
MSPPSDSPKSPSMSPPSDSPIAEVVDYGIKDKDLLKVFLHLPEKTRNKLMQAPLDRRIRVLSAFKEVALAKIDKKEIPKKVVPLKRDSPPKRWHVDKEALERLDKINWND